MMMKYEKLILDLLEERDMSGSEILRTLDERSGNVFQNQAGNLYPLLHSLVRQKKLKFYYQEKNNIVRKYYRKIC